MRWVLPQSKLPVEETGSDQSPDLQPDKTLLLRGQLPPLRGIVLLFELSTSGRVVRTDGLPSFEGGWGGEMCGSGDA